MLDFQLTHIALVGARIAAFHEYGFYSRNDLAMRRVAPREEDVSIDNLSEQTRDALLKAQLPIWIHNIIADPSFPARDRLLMPLRRFEGELHDSRNDEVISMVLSCGFKNHSFDPFDLPSAMPMRQRCAVVVHIGVWQAAYRKLETDLVTILASRAPSLASWCHAARLDHRVFH